MVRVGEIRDCYAAARKFCACAVFIIIFGLSTFYSSAHASSEGPDLGIPSLQKKLSTLQSSSELVGEIDRIIESHKVDTPSLSRLELDLWKLKVLNDISDTQRTSDFALEIYKKYDRADYKSDEQFGDTMQQLVQAFAKTLHLDLSFEIVQDLRESVTESPSVYLNFIIDKCLMEVYIETFDYKRALEIELFILNSSDYASLEALKDWKPFLLNEISFLYNRLGNGEKALEYSNHAQVAFQHRELIPTDLLKVKALNNANRARAHLLMGNYAEAEKLGREVLQAGKTLEQNYVTALGYRLIGSASYNLENPNKAKRLIEAGIKLSDAHNITTMQTYLYRDYALSLESLGDYKSALKWQKKHQSLNVKSEKAAAFAREALHNSEARYYENYQEVLKLRRENEIHREISSKDTRIKYLLMLVVTSLVMLAAILASFFYSLRKNQKKLIESENKARNANKAKSEFLANMSHEIRTPMNGVLGMLQLLQRTELNDQQRFYADIMDKSGKSLIAVISDILDFSKIESNMLKLDPVAGNLEDSMRAVTHLFSATAKEKNLNLFFEYDPALPKQFIFDNTRVRQIVSNLISNAVKFTEAGMVNVRISGHLKNDHADVSIEVRDTGMGIAEEKMALIFDKFTQAEGSITTRFGGTGLGLAISRRLAEAMDGSIEVTSLQGKGSIFTVHLPLKTVSKLKLQNYSSRQRSPKLPKVA